VSLEAKARASRLADAAVVRHGRGCDLCRVAICDEMSRLVSAASELAPFQPMWAEEWRERRELVRRVLHAERMRVAGMVGDGYAPTPDDAEVDAAFEAASPS